MASRLPPTLGQRLNEDDKQEEAWPAPVSDTDQDSLGFSIWPASFETSRQLLNMPCASPIFSLWGRGSLLYLGIAEC